MQQSERLRGVYALSALTLQPKNADNTPQGAPITLTDGAARISLRIEPNLSNQEAIKDRWEYPVATRDRWQIEVETFVIENSGASAIGTTFGEIVKRCRIDNRVADVTFTIRSPLPNVKGDKFTGQVVVAPASVDITHDDMRSQVTLVGQGALVHVTEN